MEPIDFWGALRRSWRLLLILGLVGAVIAVVIPVTHPKKDKIVSLYPWQATMVVGSSPGGPSNALGGGVTDGQIEFYAQSTAVKQATLEAAGVNILPVFGGAVISAHPDGSLTKRGQQSVPVVLAAAATSVDGAISLINTYATELADYLVNLVSQKQSQRNSSSANAGSITASSIGFEVIQPASAGLPAQAVKKASLTSSRKVRLVAGLAIGVLLAALIVLARELLDKRLRSADRAESTFGYPVVAEIPGPPKSAGEPSRGLDVVNNPESPGAEAYRMLRMSVLFEALASRGGPHAQGGGLELLVGNGLFGNGNNPLGNGHGTPPVAVSSDEGAQPDVAAKRQVVLVVSAGSEETRSQVVVNFAAAYAEAGQRAVVISTIELGNGPLGGATDRVSGEVATEDVEARLEPSTIDRVYRLPLADFVDNSAQLVTRAPAVIEAARSLADVIVVEAPPLLTVHHAEALSRAVDVVLVVGECLTTTFDDARRAGDSLRRMEAPVLGVVVTNTRLSRRDLRHAEAATRQQPAIATGSTLDPVAELVDQLSSTGASAHTET